jgi:hypothetical protein
MRVVVKSAARGPFKLARRKELLDLIVRIGGHRLRRREIERMSDERLEAIGRQVLIMHKAFVRIYQLRRLPERHPGRARA